MSRYPALDLDTFAGWQAADAAGQVVRWADIPGDAHNDWVGDHRPVAGAPAFTAHAVLPDGLIWSCQHETCTAASPFGFWTENTASMTDHRDSHQRAGETCDVRCVRRPANFFGSARDLYDHLTLIDELVPGAWQWPTSMWVQIDRAVAWPRRAPEAHDAGIAYACRFEGVAQVRRSRLRPSRLLIDTCVGGRFTVSPAQVTTIRLALPGDWDAPDRPTPGI